MDIPCSVACYILSFRLIMYRQGTEADWTFLDLFKLHSQDYPGSCCVAMLGTRMLLDVIATQRAMRRVLQMHDAPKQILGSFRFYVY